MQQSVLPSWVWFLYCSGDEQFDIIQMFFQGRFGALISAVSLQICNLTLPAPLFSTVLTDQKVMAGEAMDRRNIWEPSLYYSLGKESFYFAGHDISIRESMDTYGALIWPGVCNATMCVFVLANLVVVNVIITVYFVGNSFVPILGE